MHLNSRNSAQSMTAAAVRATRWVVVHACLLAALGCSKIQDENRRVVWRLVDDDPVETFVRENLIEVESVFNWDFSDRQELESWKFSLDPDQRRLVEGGLHLQPEKRFVTLTRSVAMTASEVDAVEIRVRGLARQPVFLDWAGPGEDFVDERHLKIDLGQDLGGGLKAYRFLLANHPQWQGAVERLRLGLVVPRDRPNVTVERIIGQVERMIPQRLAEVVDNAYKFSLDGDLRNGYLNLPGLPLMASLSVPESAELRFALGLLGTLDEEVTFMVSVETERGRDTLFEEALTVEASGWREHRVALDAHAGEDVRLIFETAKKNDLDPRLGLPIWGHVEVLGKDEDVLPNVVLISIDTLRADHLSLYGYERSTSPKIDAWARAEATVFEHTVAPSPWTLPSHTSIMTGLDALRHGVNFPQDVTAAERTLAEVLRGHGYATMAITGGGFMHPQYGFARGFDRYRAFGVRMGFENELEQGVDLARRWLARSAGRPTFLFFHTYEVHNPFRARQPYFRDLTGREDEDWVVDVEIVPANSADDYMDRRRLRFSKNGQNVDGPGDVEVWAVDLYDSSIAYADTLIGPLLADFERLDPSRPTLVVLTSDHGELFGEHGLVNHVSLYDENLLVPLIIADPRNRGIGRRISEQVRSIDILPTVLELLDLPPLAGLDGVSLAPLISGQQSTRGRAATLAWSYAPSSNYGVSVRGDDRYKYIFQHSAWADGPSESFFDLRQDPAESLSTFEDPSLISRLRRLTEATLEQHLPGLRLRLSNRGGSTALVGELSGRQIQRNRIKALRVDQGAVELDRQSRTMRFAVPAGEEWFFAIEGQDPSSLKLRLEPMSGTGKPYLRQIDPSALEGVWSVHPSGAEWLDEPQNTAEDGFSIWWSRRRADAGDAPAVIDEELRRQLEALGYVD